MLGFLPEKKEDIYLPVKQMVHWMGKTLFCCMDVCYFEKEHGNVSEKYKIILLDSDM